MPLTPAENPEHRETPGKTRTLHFVYSFECNLRCGHCLYRCGPGAGKTMSLDRAQSFLEQASRAGVRRIVFNGGEPTLHYPALLALTLLVRSRSMQADLVTNASWARSGRQARELLLELRQAGLGGLTLSTDRFHLPGVPLGWVLNALHAARDLGIRAGVKIARLPQDPIADGLFRELQPVADRIVLQQVSPLGRGSFLRRTLPLRSVPLLRQPGCLSPPVLLPDGCLLTCCNLPARDLSPGDYPFVLGNLEHASLETLLELRARDPRLDSLRKQGPVALLAPASAVRPGEDLPAQALFRDGCDLCFHLARRAIGKYLSAAGPAKGRTEDTRDHRRTS